MREISRIAINCFCCKWIPFCQKPNFQARVKWTFKKNQITENEVVNLTAALTGYDERLIGLVIGLVNTTDDVNLPTTDKLSSIKFSEDNYSSIVTATAASMLVSGFPITEAGDTKIGCILISKIPPLKNLFSLSGGTITIWIQAKDGKILVYGISKINQSSDILGVNDKRLYNIFNGVKNILAITQVLKKQMVQPLNN